LGEDMRPWGKSSLRVFSGFSGISSVRPVRGGLWPPKPVVWATRGDAVRALRLWGHLPGPPPIEKRLTLRPLKKYTFLSREGHGKPLSLGSRPPLPGCIVHETRWSPSNQFSVNFFVFSPGTIPPARLKCPGWDNRKVRFAEKNRPPPGAVYVGNLSIAAPSFPLVAPRGSFSLSLVFLFPSVCWACPSSSVPLTIKIGGSGGPSRREVSKPGEQGWERFCRSGPSIHLHELFSEAAYYFL